jgi:peptidoglycan/xylan/chitin deacetylase (PgdA/CDA1 family)
MAIILSYQLIPNLIEQHFDPQVIRRFSAQKNEIALTFDDGPSPVYTPELLDLLKEHNVHASFFLVAENAQAYPEIVKRMARKGHSSGLHSLNHRGFWVETHRQND